MYFTTDSPLNDFFNVVFLQCKVRSLRASLPFSVPKIFFGVSLYFVSLKASCHLWKERTCVSWVNNEEFSYQFSLIEESSTDGVGKGIGKLVNIDSICMPLEKKH